MSGPFKMKYTKSQGSAFPFKGEPLKMYGGMKDSPMRSWWSKVKEKVAGVAAKGKGLLGKVFGGGGGGEGGGESTGGVPQHGPEAHSGGGKHGQFAQPGMGQSKWGPDQGEGEDLTTTEGTGGMGGNTQNPMNLFKRMFGGGGSRMS